MERALALDMEAGALGLSSGLFYAPGSYAPASELVRLAKVAARFGGRYDSHIRDESAYSIGLLPAIEELIEISRQAEIPAHIAHIKALGPAVAGQATGIIELVRAARLRGQSITADQYPWLASGTRLSNALLQRWVLSGGQAAMLARLSNVDLQPRILAEISKNIELRGGADALLVTGESSLRGATLSQIAQDLAISEERAAIEVIRSGDPAVASFMMTEDDVAALMAEPWVMTGSDGSPGHPRKYGTYPHKYQKYVVQKQLLDLQTFVHRSSGLPAATFNLCDRGRLALGFKADIAIWDPGKYRSAATYEHAQRLAHGVEFLLVNGDFAIDEGKLTQRKAGAIVYAQDCHIVARQD